MIFCLPATLSLAAPPVAIVGDPPPAMAIVSGLDANATGLFNLTIGAPGSCSCQLPKACDGHTLNGTEQYHGDTGCDYYAIGGGISTIRPDGALGTPCHTWRADYKSCDVYPGSTDGSCGRIISATCSFQPGTVPTSTIHMELDMTCDTFHYENCDDSSKCCGSDFACQSASSGSSQRLCCPADTGCIHDKLPRWVTARA